MHWTTTLQRVSAIFALIVVAGAPAAGKDSLSLTANAPTIAVAPRIPGRRFLQLPSLEYKFQVRARCAGKRLAESLSLNVADSRTTISADQIAKDGPTEVDLIIPAGQIAPIVVENFCVVGEGAEASQAAAEPEQLTISAALSAQASLLCAGEEDQAMTYVSKTLDVFLQCQAAADEVASPAIN